MSAQSTSLDRKGLPSLLPNQCPFLQLLLLHMYINSHVIQPSQCIHSCVHVHVSRADPQYWIANLGAHCWGRLILPLSELSNCLQQFIHGLGPVKFPALFDGMPAGWNNSVFIQASIMRFHDMASLSQLECQNPNPLALIIFPLSFLVFPKFSVQQNFLIYLVKTVLTHLLNLAVFPIQDLAHLTLFYVCS